VVDAVPRDGFFGSRHLLARTIVVPQLALGATGPSVAELERRLAAEHYALRTVDGRFAEDTYDAVLAFQKVHGLARTGRVDASLWRRLFASSTPRARFRGTHVEVDKTRQVLFEVRNGNVVLVVPVSTGATGNTPLGQWHVYRRVTGWDWVLYYPTYFLRGFAIHGYPSVPAYPASHGCVRVPMSSADWIYAALPVGTPVYVLNGPHVPAPFADSPPPTVPTTAAPPPPPPPPPHPSSTTTTSSTTSSTTTTTTTTP